MPKYQVEVTISTSGYISLEAPSKVDAAKRVRGLEIGLDFHTSLEIDTSMIDAFADIHIDGVCLEGT